MGDKFDEKKGIELTAGGYGEAQAKMNHYAWASTPSVVQVYGQGPFAITYVNPPMTRVSSRDSGHKHKPLPVDCQHSKEADSKNQQQK